MGRADYLALGDWNVQCYQCGRKRKASMLKKHWQGFWVCPEHWEPRHPQDFVRNTTDNMTPPWSQPQPTPQFTETDFLLTEQSNTDDFDYILTEEYDVIETE